MTPPPHSSLSDALYSLNRLSKKQILMALLIIAVLVSICMALERATQLNPYLALSGDQILYHLIYIQERFPASFALDPLFGGAYSFDVANPLYMAITAPFLDHLGLISTIYLFEPILAFVYIASMSFCLYRFTGRLWISLFIAFLSAFAISSFVNERWGVMATYLILPKTYFLAVIPLLFTGWIQFQQKPRYLLLLFFIIGLLSWIHPISGLTFVAPLLMTQVAIGNFQWRAFRFAIGCGLAALVPMIPFALIFMQHVGQSAPAPASLHNEIMEATMFRLDSIDPAHVVRSFYNDFVANLGWIIPGFLAALFVRHPARRYLIVFTLSCVAIVAFIYGFNYTFILPRQAYPVLLVDLGRTIKFIYLPIIILFALWVAQVSRDRVSPRPAALLLLLLVLPAMSFHPLVEGIGDFNIKKIRRAFAQQPTAIFRHYQLGTVQDMQRVAVMDALVAASEWIKTHTRPEKTLIHVSSGSDNQNRNIFVRMLSQRGVLYTFEDGGLYFTLDKMKLLDWYHQAQTYQRIYEQGQSCTAEELSYVQQKGATHALCEQEKLALPKEFAEKILYRNDKYAIVSLSDRV